MQRLDKLNLFFFAHEKNEKQSNNSPSSSKIHLLKWEVATISAHVAPLALNIMRLRGFTVHAATTSTRPNKELAKARPAAQCQECCPPEPPNKFNSLCARWRVQNGPRFGQEPHKRALFTGPPASHFTSQDDQSGPGAGSNEFGMSAFLPTPSNLQRHAVDVGAAPGRAVPSQRGLTSVASMASCMPPKQREAPRRQLPTVGHRVLVGPVGPGLEPSRWWKPGRLPRGQYSGHCILHSKSTSYQQPCDWPKESSWRPHRQVRTVGGRGRWSLRSSKTRKRWGGIRVGKLDGVADNAAPENGPLCDLKRAFSLSLNTGINVCSLWWRSTLEAASCCHPVRQEPGSNSMEGAAPCKTACQEGGSKPMTPDNSSRAEWAATRDGGSCTNSEDTPRNASATLLWSVVEHAQ